MCQDAAGVPVLEETSWYLMFRRRSDKVGRGRPRPLSCCNLHASYVLWFWVRYVTRQAEDRGEEREAGHALILLLFVPGCDEGTRLVLPKGTNAHMRRAQG